jgi:hypothetical protein
MRHAGGRANSCRERTTESLPYPDTSHRLPVRTSVSVCARAFCLSLPGEAGRRGRDQCELLWCRAKARLAHTAYAADPWSHAPVWCACARATVSLAVQSHFDGRQETGEAHRGRSAGCLSSTVLPQERHAGRLLHLNLVRREHDGPARPPAGNPSPTPGHCTCPANGQSSSGSYQRRGNLRGDWKKNWL